MNIKTKAFLESILNHSRDPEKVKKMMTKDKRLSRDEKTIVNCFLLMRRNKNSEALAIAEDISKQQDPFVESMRCFVLAGLLNNLNLHHQALKYFRESYGVLPKNILPHFEFITLLNLFHLAINLRDFKNANIVLSNMQKIKELNEEDSLTLSKCFFNYYTVTENLPEAKKAYVLIKKNLSKFKSHTLSAIYLDFWDYGITFQQYDLCLEALEQMKAQKTYVLTQNYNYMKILLMHFLEGNPVYIVENEFKEYPDLLIQLKFIRALESNRVSEAKTLWSTLQNMKPHVFAANFEQLGQKTILLRCLDKYRSKLLEMKPSLIRDSGLSITDSIEKALLSNDEISKEELFHFLYGREAESKDDFNRLARDIYKFKMSKQVEINSKKGRYSLIKKAG